MTSARVKAAVAFFDGERPTIQVPPGFYTAGQWALRLNATDVKHVRQQLRFMVHDGLAKEIEGRWRGQLSSFFKLLPVKRCAHCKSITGAIPRKLFANEYA